VPVDGPVRLFEGLTDGDAFGHCVKVQTRSDLI